MPIDADDGNVLINSKPIGDVRCTCLIHSALDVGYFSHSESLSLALQRDGEVNINSTTR